MGSGPKISVTGLANSGKSAFLTSLLWQLAEFPDANFLLSDKARVEGFRESKVNGDIGAPFPFDRYRDALTRSRRWPDKSTDCYRYACKYVRSDWRGFSLRRASRLHWGNQQQLEFFDFPGERVADAAIAAFDDFAKWSRHILDHMASHSDYCEAARPYFNLLGQDDFSEDAVILAYKQTLAKLILGYKPLITPSVFLLDAAGQPASGTDANELAAARCVGVDAQSQFAPLSDTAMNNAPELAALMATRYREYRKELVLPLFRNIGQSNRLVVLVDIPSLLMGGVGRYNDNRQVLLDLFEALRPDSSIGAQLRRLFKFWQGRISRVAFVATKADLVHPSDVSNGRLESLLRQMTTRAKTLLENVDFDWFVCSACRSTRPGSSEQSLIGRLTSEGLDAGEVEFQVSALPDAWPEDWSNGQYKFSRVQPLVSKNLQIPPDHLSLDQVFDFLVK